MGIALCSHAAGLSKTCYAPEEQPSGAIYYWRITMKEKKINIRMLTFTAIMSAVSTVLMYLQFPMPFIIPAFIQMDFSELPALIVAFAYGPIAGVAVCLIKNLLHLFGSTTMGVGELSNFLLGASFVFTAGLIYKNNKSRMGALLGTLIGAAFMAVISFPINLFITYPFFTAVFFGGNPAPIMGMYQALLPWADTLPKALLVFNVPFNFVLKGLANAAIAFLVYKSLSPVLKGRSKT